MSEPKTEDVPTPRSIYGLALKPSVLIREALEDLRKAEQSRDYFVDMDMWHTPLRAWGDENRHQQCAVCLAGATIAFRATTKPEPWAHLGPDHFYDGSTSSLLHALNNARVGNWPRFRSYVMAVWRARGEPMGETAWPLYSVNIDPELRKLGQPPRYSELDDELKDWLACAAAVWAGVDL